MGRAVPALEHAAPAVATSSEGLGTSLGAPFHSLNMTFSRNGRTHGLLPADTLYSNSPVNGLLFVHGTIGKPLFHHLFPFKNAIIFWDISFFNETFLNLSTV